MTFDEVDPKYLVDVFGAVVQDVREQWDEANVEAPFYLHGHPKEILQILMQKDKSANWKYRKYPLVALFQDFPENKGTDPKFEMIAPTLRLIIVTSTKREFDSMDRYRETLKPTLYPIYEQLLESMADSGFFDITTSDQIEHTKHDRLFWGREGLYGSEANIFNDYLDAIDITFNNLEVNSKNIC